MVLRRSIRVERGIGRGRIMASNLLQALVPLFFVLALGYAAGRFHSFDADQATGFNTLLADFALPAMLFASTVTIKRAQLLGEAPVVLTLAVVYVGVFMLAGGAAGRFVRGSGLRPVGGDAALWRRVPADHRGRRARH